MAAALEAGRQQWCHRMLELGQRLGVPWPRARTAHSLRIRIAGFQRLPVFIVVGHRGQPQERQCGLPASVSVPSIRTSVMIYQ